MISNRKFQLVTSIYGMRKGQMHNGIDLRSYSDGSDGNPIGPKNPVILPEKAIFKRAVFEEKWGWTYIFDPVDTDYYEIQFTHMHKNDSLTVGNVYDKGTSLGFTMVTEYMMKKGLGDHLHFAVRKEKDFSDPLEYYTLLRINYKIKKG